MVCPHLRRIAVMSASPRVESIAGTMFELVKELKDGAEALKKQSSNPISLNAGCELFIEFVTLFPHETAVSKSFLTSVALILIVRRPVSRASLRSRPNLSDKAHFLSLSPVFRGSIMTIARYGICLRSIDLSQKNSRSRVRLYQR